MHKKLLAVAVTSTLLAMGAAQAQVPAGTGDVLVGAIYSTEGGQDTFVNIVNTTENAKAVKVRFREGRGSEDSLDFHVYLSPFDMWAAAVTKDGDDVVVVTQDTSCTVPFVDSNPATTGARMRTTYIPDVFDPEAAGGITAEARVREGYVEIIEMADFGDDTGLPLTDPNDPDSARVADAATASSNLANAAPDSTANIAGHIAWASKHVNGVPRNCGAINSFNGQNHSPNTASTSLFGDPTGGLFGNMALINVAQGTYVPFEMDAFETDAGGPIFFSQNANQGTGDLEAFTQDQGLVFEKITVAAATDLQYFDLPDLSTTNDGSSPLRFVDGINNEIAATDVVNEYVVDTTIGASTDWVLTFPTKKFHVDGPYNTETGAPLPTAGLPIAPFSSRFNQRTATACESIQLSYYDREERSPMTPPGGPDFSPGRPDVAPGNNLCFEMNVVSFNDGTLASPSRVVGGLSTRQNLNVDYQSGWASIKFTGDNADGAGLPVIGFGAYNLVNNNVAGGVLANYGGGFAHRYVRPGL